MGSPNEEGELEDVVRIMIQLGRDLHTSKKSQSLIHSCGLQLGRLQAC